MKKWVASLMSSVILKRIYFLIVNVKKVKKLMIPQVVIESKKYIIFYLNLHCKYSILIILLWPSISEFFILILKLGFLKKFFIL